MRALCIGGIRSKFAEQDRTVCDFLIVISPGPVDGVEQFRWWLLEVDRFRSVTKPLGYGPTDVGNAFGSLSNHASVS